MIDNLATVESTEKQEEEQEARLENPIDYGGEKTCLIILLQHKCDFTSFNEVVRASKIFDFLNQN